MKKYCIFALAFIYLEIFSRQATGLNSILYFCEYSYSLCLDFSDAKVTWETANSTCTEQGGRLDAIRFHGIPGDTGGEYYWTEFHRVPNTMYFQTTDGVNLSNSSYSDYYSWKLNHPIDSIDCVGFDRESREFLSLACNTIHLAVCRIDEATCNALVEEYKDICPSVTLRLEMQTEDILRNLSSNFNVTTGDYIQLYKYPNELVVTQVSANTTTEITHYWNSIQISEDPYEERKTFVWRIPYSNTEYYNNSTFIVISDVITAYTSSINSVSNMTIVFSAYDYLTGRDKCMHLTPEGYWSAEGVETELISSETVQCTTKIQNIRTIAVGRFIIPRAILISLLILVLIFSLISLFLLVSSLVIFIASGKKFFSYDINILHFNNTLSLLLAIISITFFAGAFYSRYSSIPVSFFLHFLWTNVFLSSLSIAIVVFYTIWIVSINHTARKLSIFLIPIGWGVSLIWAGVWALVGYLKCKHLNRSECLISNNYRFNTDWSFLGSVIVILLINTALLIASLFKVWLVLRKQSSQQGELKRLRKVVISGFLLISVIGLPFVPLLALKLYEALNKGFHTEQNTLAFLIILFINSPIGIIHFVLITCQIRETNIRKYCCCCCCCRRITPAQIAHSLHLNIVRPRPKQKNHQSVIENSTIQQPPVDTIPNSVPSIDSAVCSNDSTQAVI